MPKEKFLLLWNIVSFLDPPTKKAFFEIHMGMRKNKFHDTNAAGRLLIVNIHFSMHPFLVYIYCFAIKS